jgi:serine/threonine-protein kinase
MKSGFWKTDWFLGLVVVVAFVAFNRSSDLVASLERKAYDMGVQASTRAPHPDVVVIAIDDVSIANIGRWPWQRDVLAKMTDKLAAAKAKVVGSTVLLSEPQVDRGYEVIVKAAALLAPPAGSEAPAAENPALTLLRQAEQELNTDRKLAESYAKAGNVVIPMNFRLGSPLGKPDQPLPEYIAKQAVPGSVGTATVARPAVTLEAPIETLGKAAAGIGHLTSALDVDGTVRFEPLVLQYYDRLFPSLALQIAAKSLNLGPADIKVEPGEAVSLGKLRIPTDAALDMQTFFYKDRERPAFQVDSFWDVYSDRIPASKYAGKIVLLGATAAGVGGTLVTPVNAATPPVLSVAHSVSSILEGHFFVTPSWGPAVELGVFLLVACYLVVLLPRLGAASAASVTAGALAALVVAQMMLMSGQGLWLQLMTACTLLLVGHLALVTKRFIGTERAKLKSDESSAESNRMLGLAYQGQGQLDLAWDKFRQVPASDALLDNLYNLGLDFERKRQFNKAEAVFRHIHAFDAKFRDVGEKSARAKQLSETLILGGGASHPGGTLQLSGAEKPKFGRFEVQKELGKGAMGVVYLGKDPKIGREVAIKTLALAQEFEPDELAGAKERFFREAETAGKLSHPNIVTIYDTGEEHDFCYIAMELLKGGDLVAHTKAGKLLPPDKVVSLVARAAEALGYAHREGVVHRDVKPANMMYDAQTDTLKLTDFGIARLTASSKTKTGMVLGTPSYMSPEQLAGQRIDGRSDLFSLAVTLYLLLAGRLPFEGESMAQLMFKIANDAPADIRKLNAGVPAGLAAFLERALAKNPQTRFQTGEEFSGALRAALATGAARPAHAIASVDIEL